MKINSLIGRTFMDAPADCLSRADGWLGHAHETNFSPIYRPLGSWAMTALGMVSSSKQVRHQTDQEQNYENEKENSGNLRSSESDNAETKDARY